MPPDLNAYDIPASACVISCLSLGLTRVRRTKNKTENDQQFRTNRKRAKLVEESLNAGHAHHAMMIFRLNGGHFGLPPSSVYNMTGLGGKNGVNDDVCTQAPFGVRR